MHLPRIELGAYSLRNYRSTTELKMRFLSVNQKMSYIYI